MEQFGALEKKLSLLIESKKSDMQQISKLSIDIENYKQECLILRDQLEQLNNDLSQLAAVTEENIELRLQIEKLQETLLIRHQSIDGLNQERELTKMAVDDLIKSIDILIEPEQ